MSPSRSFNFYLTEIVTVLQLFLEPAALAGSHSQKITCRKLFINEAFELLAPGSKSTETSVYFGGSSERRIEHANTMDNGAYRGVLKLLDRYRALIPAGLPVLEVGPYLRPLGLSIALKNPWLVWDYDNEAAQKIADMGAATVFRIDLNALDREGWKRFWFENRVALKALWKKKLLGGAIISQVLNYVDYRTVLKNIIHETADGGILFIGNMNAGDRNLFKEKLNGSQILEFLLINFADQVEILPESKLFMESFEGSRSGISLAVRIHKIAGRRTVDQYLSGLGIYADYEYNYASIWEKSRDDNGALWDSTDSELIERAIKDGMKRAPWNRFEFPRIRLAEIELEIKRIDSMIERVIGATHGTNEFDNLLAELAHPRYERFLPERHILINALHLPRDQRTEFIREKRKALFKQMGHEMRSRP